jgi:hypothetical protein
MKTDTEFVKQTSEKFKEGFDRIFKAVNQLDSDQIWSRPSSESNSVGIILQHLNGNLNQWICAGVGGTEFHRNRPEEFLDHQKLSKEEILKKVLDLGGAVENVLGSVSPESLHSPRRIQGLDATIMSAILKALTHFEFHEGQILYIAKLLLDKKYEVIWPPKKQP